MAHLRSVSVARTLAVLGLIPALMLTSACSKKAAVGTGALAGPPPAVSPTPAGATTAPATVAPSGTATTTATTTTTTTTSAPTTAAPTKVATGPHLSFVVTQQPACPVFGDGTDAPFTQAGTNIKLKWNATGEVKRVALSLDSPGFFQQYGTGSIDTYAPQGSIELPFECDPTVLPNTTHKYTMDTIGGGKTVEITITVTKPTSL